VRKKRKNTTRRKKSFVFIKTLFVLVFLGLISLVYIWQKVVVLKLSQGIKNIRSEISEKEKRCKYLEIEIAKLSSIVRIEDVAHSKLGLTYPQTDQIFFLKESNIQKNKKKEYKFDLARYFKKLADDFLNVPENSLEAKEIKHDL